MVMVPPEKTKLTSIRSVSVDVSIQMSYSNRPVSSASVSSVPLPLQQQLQQYIPVFIETPATSSLLWRRSCLPRRMHHCVYIAPRSINLSQRPSASQCGASSHLSSARNLSLRASLLVMQQQQQHSSADTATGTAAAVVHAPGVTGVSYHRKACEFGGDEFSFCYPSLPLEGDWCILLTVYHVSTAPAGDGKGNSAAALAASGGEVLVGYALVTREALLTSHTRGIVLHKLPVVNISTGVLPDMQQPLKLISNYHHAASAAGGAGSGCYDHGKPVLEIACWYASTCVPHDIHLRTLMGMGRSAIGAAATGGGGGAGSGSAIEQHEAAGVGIESVLTSLPIHCNASQLVQFAPLLFEILLGHVQSAMDMDSCSCLVLLCDRLASLDLVLLLDLCRNEVSLSLLEESPVMILQNLKRLVLHEAKPPALRNAAMRQSFVFYEIALRGLLHRQNAGNAGSADGAARRMKEVLDALVPLAAFGGNSNSTTRSMVLNTVYFVICLAEAHLVPLELRQDFLNVLGNYFQLPVAEQQQQLMLEISGLILSEWKQTLLSYCIPCHGNVSERLAGCLRQCLSLRFSHQTAKVRQGGLLLAQMIHVRILSLLKVAECENVIAAAFLPVLQTLMSDAVCQCFSFSVNVEVENIRASRTDSRRFLAVVCAHIELLLALTEDGAKMLSSLVEREWVELLVEYATVYGLYEGFDKECERVKKEFEVTVRKEGMDAIKSKYSTLGMAGARRFFQTQQEGKLQTLGNNSTLGHGYGTGGGEQRQQHMSFMSTVSASSMSSLSSSSSSVASSSGGGSLASTVFSLLSLNSVAGGGSISISGSNVSAMGGAAMSPADPTIDSLAKCVRAHAVLQTRLVQILMDVFLKDPHHHEFLLPPAGSAAAATVASAPGARVLACLRVLARILSESNGHSDFTLVRCLDRIRSYDTTDHYDLLARPVLAVCVNRRIVVHSAATLYVLLKHQTRNMVQWDRAALTMTVLLSQLQVHVPLALSLVRRFTEMSRGSRKEADGDADVRIEVLTSRLQQICRDTLRILRLRRERPKDYEALADVYANIALVGYAHAPALRIAWLENLCEMHLLVGKQREYEAAVALVFMLRVIVEYVPLPKVTPNACNFTMDVIGTLEKLAPGVRQMLLPPIHNPGSQLVEGSSYPDIHSLLTRTAGYFEAAGAGEAAALTLMLRFYLFQTEPQQTFRAISDMFGLVRSAGPLSTFYRVGVPTVSIGAAEVGAGAGPAPTGEKEYVYRMPRITRLAEIKQYLETLGYASAKIMIVAQVNENTFTYEQITGTLLKEQTKRRVTLVTELPGVPGGLIARVLVTSQSTVELGPMENAQDIISTRTAVLQKLVESASDVSLNALQMALQGSVRVMIHGGIPEVVTSFFPCEDGDAAATRQLARLLVDFLDVCEKGVKLNGTFVAAGNTAAMDFQKELEKGLEELRAFMGERGVLSSLVC